MTAVVHTRTDLAAALDAHPGTGRRAVVMTMGALHSGHLLLVDAARDAVGSQGQVVVTIFVNPLQFGPHEDLDAYPRDLPGDVEKLHGRGVDVVFAPERETVYPGGDPRVTVSAGHLGTILEGAQRPGHFDGVLTVVHKLLRLTRPDVAVFGEKDAQQLLAVRRLVLDLEHDVEILGVPTARDDDGLALSSRNAYLSAGQRTDGLALSRALAAGRAAGPRGASAVLASASTVLADVPGVRVDYLALVDPVTVEEVDPSFSGRALLLVAGRVGTTRLLDNVAVEVTALPEEGSS
ncbi:pantoate--beta-alanine ligase [Paraoerskovia marina]|uniref:pantoate--beta-alanine ligase n=1 Tax=Paraoerskovia marina TaxID=545619 RepID=UPI000492B862|nr:pantoate--beta-alanine ligase [Paraoerskovia marina]